MRRPFRSIPLLSLVCIAVFAAKSTRAEDGNQPASASPNIVDRVGQAVATIRLAQHDLAAAPLDEDAVIDRIGREPAKLCQWVKSNIAYEPYRGFLKGGPGALVSGQANSADKALLLADLLIKAGYKAQLVQGNTPPPPAPAPSATRQRAVDNSPDEKTLAALAAHTGIPIDRLRQLQKSAASEGDEFNERLWNRTLGDLQTIAGLLDQAKIPVPPLTVAAAPVDHWWVRIPSGEFDPTFDAVPPKGGRAFDPGRLPAAEYHQIAVRMMIRQDNAAAKVLQSSYRSADVFGRTLTIANFPLEIFQKLAAISSPTSDKVLDVLATASKFQPQIMLSGVNGADSAKVVSGRGFDLSGSQFDVSHGQVQSAQNLGGGLGGLFGGGGGGKATPNTKLTAAWIEIDLAAPGLAPLTIHRNLFVNSPDLTPRQKVFDLLATREILLLPEDVSEDFATSLMFDSVTRWAQYLSAHAQSSIGAPDVKAFQGRPQFNSRLFAFAVGRRAAVGKLCDGRFGVTAFTHVRPTAVSYVSRFIDGRPPLASRSIDILENTIPPAAGAKPAEQGWAGNFGLACGVLDTALEHEILRNGETHQNASVALEQSILEGNSPAVVARALPADLKLSQMARATIAKELSRSAIVVVPGTPAAWYRVGLDNGATLGFIEGGGGQEASEYAEMAEILNQMIEMINFYGDLGRCLGASISNPLAGKNDPHESLKECFEGICSMMPATIAGLSEVEATWSNLIYCKSISQIWEGVCEKLWDKLGPGEGSGEGGGGGE